MKKLLTLLALLVALNLSAQKNKERIKALKVSFITERLDLSQEEAQKFWPIYNEYDNKSNEVRFTEIRSIRKEIRTNLETMSNDDAEKLITRLNKAEIALHTIRTSFFTKLSGTISPKKIILLKIAEEDFKRKMLNELKNRRKR